MRFIATGIVASLAFAIVAAQDTVRLVRAGTAGIAHPRLLTSVLPVYPPIAQAARVSGLVAIEAIIDETGRVMDATVTRSIPLLDAAAIGAVRKWQFEPPRLSGREVRFASTAGDGCGRHYHRTKCRMSTKGNSPPRVR